MRKFVLATSVALAAMTASAHAADLDYERELGLIVSGVVDQWMGAQFIKGPLLGGGPGPGFSGSSDDTFFTTGGEGLLSLPLGENLSIQSDIKYETNSTSFGSTNSNVFGPEIFVPVCSPPQLARSPVSWIVSRIFGGMGTADFNRRSQCRWLRLESGLDTRLLAFLGGEGTILHE
jgi:hypothetical protein